MFTDPIIDWLVLIALLAAFHSFKGRIDSMTKPLKIWVVSENYVSSKLN